MGFDWCINVARCCDVALFFLFAVLLGVVVEVIGDDEVGFRDTLLLPTVDRVCMGLVIDGVKVRVL